ncbi:MAG TPA: dipeptidase [Firmicutes bacterium]|nr:dipeptidase [Candidatus Fermentithermobacillaceae bacterium]
MRYREKGSFAHGLSNDSFGSSEDPLNGRLRPTQFADRHKASVQFPFEVPDDESIPVDCSAVIVGKKASATGEVLYGHNEDDSGNNVMVQYKVPRAKHEPGELITFEPTCAKIPQVEETWSYLWSETRAPWQASFSDTFINEWGVAVGSDSCNYSREDNPELVEGGIGYGVGHIIAQRARTAREGVMIAAELVDRYGYTGSGRCYQIVDKDEGWVFQVVQGKHYVAQRVPDDEVFFIPNWYTIHKVDLADKDNFIASPDLITYAIKRGWYVPAKEGDYSDFDFAAAYQNPTQNQAGNIVRHKNALRLILGAEPDDPTAFSVKPPRKLGIEDVKRILRTHYEGTEDDLSQGYELNPHRAGNRTICTGTTLESFVIQFREQPEFTCVWRATLNPCTSPYVPWYLGISKVPAGYGWLLPQVAFANHFNVPAGDLSYRPGRAWWAFQDVQDLADASYKTVIKTIKERRDALETKWVNAQEAFEAAARQAFLEDPAKGIRMLTEYTDAQAGLAWRTWRALFNDLMKV